MENVPDCRLHATTVQYNILTNSLYTTAKH